VQFLVTVDANGRLVDYIATCATHYALLPAAIQALQGARFESAIVEARPVQSSLLVKVKFCDPEQEALKAGSGLLPFGGTISEAAERRIYEVSKEHYLYRCSQPSELDNPLMV
jgi:hypothetical protein